MADETLLYTASFDPTGIIQGEAVAAKAFTDLDRKAAVAFGSIDKNADGARKILLSVGNMSRETGRQVQMAGYQVGDFFVQLASGQGVIRPLIQQSAQLLQGWGMWGSVLGAAAAILGSVYMMLRKNTDAAKELSATELPDWMTDRVELSIARHAMEQVADANAMMTFQIESSMQVVSASSAYLIAYSDAAEQAAKAQKKFLETVGMTPEEFKKQIGQFTNFKQYVLDAQERANAHMLDRQDEFAQEQAKAKENELDKLLSMETIAYEKSKRSERAYYTAIRDDVKKSDAERRKAKEDLGDALELAERTHQQRVANITGTYNEKEAEKEAAKNKKATDEAKRERDRQEREAAATFKAMSAARQREVDELRAFQATKADIAADLDIRSVEAGGSDTEKLEARQARERQALQKRLDDNAKNLDLSIKQHEDYYAALDRLAVIHSVERQKVIKEETDRNKKDMKDAARDLGRAYISLGNQIAETFHVGPLKTFFGWLERIRTMVETIRTIQTATKALSLLGGGGAGVSLMGLLGFANGGRPPVGQPYIVGERGPEIRMDDTPGRIFSNSQSKDMLGGMGAASYNFGDIQIHVPPGTPTQAIGPLVKSAVVEAAKQIEANRNQRHFRDGTFNF